MLLQHICGFNGLLPSVSVYCREMLEFLSLSKNFSSSLRYSCGIGACCLLPNLLISQPDPSADSKLLLELFHG